MGSENLDYDRLTDRPTDRLTDMRAHTEVSFPKNPEIDNVHWGLWGQTENYLNIEKRLLKIYVFPGIPTWNISINLSHET